MKRRRIITTLILTLTLSLQSISVFAQPNKEVSNISSEKTDINNGWVHENNNWYYILNNEKITGWKEIDDNWYHFNSEGIMETGWQFINGDWYYLKSNGPMATGWQFINDDWYYLKPNGPMATGWQSINDDWYYLKPNGPMVTGWQFINNDWYYLKSNGPMATSWQKINDDWYYLKPNGPMATGWQKIDNNWYYLNSNGPMATGWRFLDNNWYHLSENGPMTIGWKNSDDKWYYLDDNGAMAQDSEKTINGNIYKFDSDGVMITDKWFESTYVNKDGIVLHGSPSRSHSYTQYKLFNYMSNEDNRESVHYAAIDLHGGETTNNCVYFTSEALRRAGVKIPLYVANTYQLERELLSRGWIRSTNTSDLRPGDVVFSGYKHSFTFMNWYDDDYAYIVDNQKKYFDSVLHRRLVSVDDPVNGTIRATHFFYLPE
ncbi:TPA: N-acetylmuramoyl-L-alanine amidase family protein [Clostridium perfringens]|uniref:N-acetylmuramoyl-L-alanine amidase family protein n=1 Tax=Clostridium perfringens TaxID=1502 RepID=UPI00103D9C13|nr:N-acetylmuramoyl-L-alanine amidase family protein [Clostridium perfringens]EGT0696418.1 N-acetylmuramoyl-L-alanine amidase family protein [Clostridium perfringens]EGT3604091.1 N-acetylmuramoyl-L-alanine amidase family protein [Clostridium perfringens]EHK2354633.1 N-acetylmuramoyl-L-alanine amidase family protein [Clostridium perfringens]EHK2363390.1 N-acetylmuramoyl-L-alanine amidase family protein [Clostridium perfringens]EHK2387793.1 N-acetylmuramoyl-L-alanine amidase family protein [Clos